MCDSTNDCNAARVRCLLRECDGARGDNWLDLASPVVQKYLFCSGNLLETAKKAGPFGACHLACFAATKSKATEKQMQQWTLNNAKRGTKRKTPDLNDAECLPFSPTKRTIVMTNGIDCPNSDTDKVQSHLMDAYSPRERCPPGNTLAPTPMHEYVRITEHMCSWYQFTGTITRYIASIEYGDTASEDMLQNYDAAYRCSKSAEVYESAMQRVFAAYVQYTYSDENKGSPETRYENNVRRMKETCCLVRQHLFDHIVPRTAGESYIEQYITNREAGTEYRRAISQLLTNDMIYLDDLLPPVKLSYGHKKR